MTEEDRIQASIVKFFRKTYVGRCAAVANGGWRNQLEAVKLKMTGVDAGHPDLVFWCPHGPFLMEVKTPKGTVSKPQKEYFEDLRGMAFPVAVVHSLEEAQAAMKMWQFQPKGQAERSEAERRTML